MSCPYENILGKSNEGIHSYRIFDLAAVDLAMTLMAAWLFSRYVNTYSVLVNFILLWIIGIALHLMFCIKSPITNFITKTV